MSEWKIAGEILRAAEAQMQSTGAQGRRDYSTLRTAKPFEGERISRTEEQVVSGGQVVYDKKTMDDKVFKAGHMVAEKITITVKSPEQKIDDRKPVAKEAAHHALEQMGTQAGQRIADSAARHTRTANHRQQNPKPGP